jgi:hypothetical protein
MVISFALHAWMFTTGGWVRPVHRRQNRSTRRSHTTCFFFPFPEAYLKGRGLVVMFVFQNHPQQHRRRDQSGLKQVFASLCRRPFEEQRRETYDQHEERD